MNKKNILIIVGIILVIIIVFVAIFFINKNGKENNSDEGTRLEQIYQRISENDNYTVSLTVDDNNKEVYYIRGNNARIESQGPDENSVTIVKDGNTYIMKTLDKKCYVYKNNTGALNQIKEKIEKIKSVTPTKGKEKLDNKNYEYEEFNGVSEFLINYYNNTDQNTIKTRLYFDKDQLVYSKTTDKNLEQLTKIDINYTDSDVDFNIPSDFEIIE